MTIGDNLRRRVIMLVDLIRESFKEEEIFIVSKSQ